MLESAESCRGRCGRDEPPREGTGPGIPAGHWPVPVPHGRGGIITSLPTSIRRHCSLPPAMPARPTESQPNPHCEDRPPGARSRAVADGPLACRRAREVTVPGTLAADRAGLPPGTRAASTLTSSRPVKPAAAPRKRRNDAAIRPGTRACGGRAAAPPPAADPSASPAGQVAALAARRRGGLRSCPVSTDPAGATAVHGVRAAGDRAAAARAHPGRDAVPQRL